ncbi:MAG: 3-dehydroquinate synthase [Endomicrobia bacterium]|nr:3-dehydroquinate synthase [Endomicrobiia bacterium]
MKKIEVNILENKKINVYITNLENILGLIKDDYNNFLLVTHRKLWLLYKDKFKKFDLEVLFLPEGEKIKSFFYLEKLLGDFFKYGLNRKSLVGIFGGGVLGDLVGFASSIYMRGIKYIQIPTTLLAMVDSSIGGKTAVNLFFGKNLIGSFYQPSIILCDVSLLKSLPEKEIYNGLGEILKYSLINHKVFDLLKNNKLKFFYDENFIKNLILECIKTKLEIVKVDEKECIGIREKLNLGHTLAHSIETVTGYNVYSHGEAVVLGLVGELYISFSLGILKHKDFNLSIKLIDEYIVNKKFNKAILNINNEKIFSYIKFDKKVYNKNYRMALPYGIGDVRVVENIPKKIIIESFKYIKEWLRKLI